MNGTTSGTSKIIPRANRGYGPESVYRFELSRRTQVVADLIPQFWGAILYLQSMCGVSASTDFVSSSAWHIDRVLQPGVYFLVVDGDGPTHAGSFILNVTMIPR